MNKNEIMSKVTQSAHKVGFSMKKHSPEILVVVGVVGTVASTVMACRATTKVNDILDKTKNDVDTIHEVRSEVENGTIKEEYTDEDVKKDLAIVYIQTGVKVAKLYAPSVALGALSITSILASHKIMRKRNAGLVAAYTAVDKGFKEYRSRVVDRFGEKVDHELRHNIKAKKIEETVVDEETGKKKKVKKTVDISEQNNPSDYARFFDEASCHWEKDSEYNLMFLRSQQNYANDLLRAKGHLFLNDVYKLLDIPETKEGQVVGWLYNPDDPNSDCYVDFGIYEANRERRNFVNGYERSILLDFNVDGPILDKFC